MRTAGRRIFTTALTALALAAGCEWEQADSFNTSHGGGASVNFSGIYTEFKPEKLSGGGACGGDGAVVCGTGITRLIVTQTGNTIEVLDNANNYYLGTVGSPGVIGSPDVSGKYPAGADILQAQVSFEGGDVRFIGIVRAVAVRDVEGETLAISHTRDDTQSEDSTKGETGDETTTDDATTTVVTETTRGDTTVTTTTTSSGTSREGETDTQNRTDSETETRTRSESYSREYSIDESGTMFVLEGNWIQGGSVRQVRGWSHGTALTVTTAQPAPEPTTTSTQPVTQ